MPKSTINPWGDTDSDVETKVLVLIEMPDDAAAGVQLCDYAQKLGGKILELVDTEKVEGAEIPTITFVEDDT